MSDQSGYEFVMDMGYKKDDTTRFNYWAASLGNYKDNNGNRVSSGLYFAVLNVNGTAITAPFVVF